MYGTGLFVDIYHPRLNVTTRYLHLSSANVSVGDEVFKGMIIGKVGNTGCVLPRPTQQNPLGGSHLHFGVFDNASGSFVDPKGYLNGGNGGGSCDQINNSPDSNSIDLVGTPEDKYGGKNVNSLIQPEIHLIVKNHEGNTFLDKVEYKLPSPEITYIEIADDNKSFTVYGIAINKNMPAKFKIDYYNRTARAGEVESHCETYEIFLGITQTICIPSGIQLSDEYDHSILEYIDTLDHTGLNLFEQEGGFNSLNGDQSISWLWNDSVDGKWQITLPLDDKNQYDLNIGDKIYAKSYIWGDTQFSIGGTKSVSIYKSESKGLESGTSNVVKIKATNVIDTFIRKVLKHYDDKIGCKNGGESVESGVDCRGLALLSIREATGKGPGGFNCDKFGDCNSENDIPSTGSDGLAKNYFPYFGGQEKSFSYLNETVNPEKGGLTIYDWDGDGKYDHVNIIVDVDSQNNRTWIYSANTCDDPVHLHKIKEADLITLKNKILAASDNSQVNLTEYEKSELLIRIYLIEFKDDEVQRLNDYYESIDEAWVIEDHTDLKSKNYKWSESILSN